MTTAMVSRKEGAFAGLSPKAFDFLKGLQANNDKAWFEANKQDFQRYLVEPLQDLVADLSAFMLAIDPHFETLPKVGRTISRIYRDTRFSRDKSPYRSTMWFTFKRPSKQWIDAPGYFFEISPNSYRYGMGYYSASKGTMDRLREKMDKRPEEFRRVVSFFSRQQVFVLEGEKYKRDLRSDIPEDFQEWYQRRNLYLVCNRKIDDRLLCRELVDDLIFGFGLVAPFYQYLLEMQATSAAG